MLTNPVLDMRECMADMAGAQEILRARDYWSLSCRETWSLATPVLKSEPVTWAQSQSESFLHLREQSIIISLNKGKGVALERGKYQGLKLLNQVIKVLENVAEKFIWQQVHMDDMQFVFLPGCSTTDAISIVRQLQQMFCAVNNTWYMAFVNLEKALDHVPRHVIWWALHKLGVEGWLVRLIQSMYENQKQSACWLQPEQRVQCESGCSPRLLLEPPTIHLTSGSPLARVSYRMSLGNPVCSCDLYILEGHGSN